MRKINLFKAALVGGILFLAACSHSMISAQEAGEMLINQIIYGNDEEAFSENFVDAEQIIADSHNWLVDFIFYGYDFLLLDEGLFYPSSSDQDLIFETTLNSLRSHTSFEISAIEEDGATATFFVYVYGLDSIDFLTVATRRAQSTRELLTISGYPENEIIDALSDLLVELHTETIHNFKARSERVEIAFVLERAGNRWQVAAEDEIKTLAFAFVNGFSDEVVFVDELLQSLTSLRVASRNEVGDNRFEPCITCDIALTLTSDEMLRFEQEHALSADQERILAFGAFIPTRNRESSRIFVLGASKSSASDLLSNSWNVRDNEAALRQLALLSAAEGHTLIADDIFNTLIKNGHLEPLDPVTGFDMTGLENILRNVERRAEEYLEEFILEFGVEDDEERAEVAEFITMLLVAERVNGGLIAYRGAKEMLIESFDYTEAELLSIPTLAAWDYGRTAVIARYGVAAGHLTEDEAWNYLTIAANNAADTYNDWREYLAAYILGRAVAFQNNSRIDFFETIDFLLNHESSPFQRIEFE